MSAEMNKLSEGQHGFKAHSDGGDYVPVQTRSERLKSTEVTDFPEVTGREVDWKYVPVATIKEFADSKLDGSKYEFEQNSVAGFTAEWIAKAEASLGEAGISEDKVSANAWTSVESVLQVTIDGTFNEELILSRSDLGKTLKAAHTVIRVKAGSKALLSLENYGEAQLAENVEIILENNSELTLVSLQEWSETSRHFASHFAKIGNAAKLKHIVLSLGGELVRLNPSAWLAEDRSDAELFGLYFSDAGQHLEHQVYVNHNAPNTRSRVNYKGALNGKGARSVWIGDVLIQRNATGTDSYEQNRNLVLSEGTRADSIPNLEIETGDIAGAGHASTTGRFDDEQLFYLQARGISEEEARRLVVKGFLTEIIQQIGSARLEEKLAEALEAELAAAAATAGGQR